jgi:ketosteroid isomerase-like protein
MVDRETAAWNSQDADALVDLFHPDMVWAWPPDPTAHDPATWITPLGRYDRVRWKAGWEDLFRSYVLVHNNRQIARVFLSEQKDAGFAVVDVDTLWRHRETGSLFHWKGRACKGYTRMTSGWLLIFHSGLLEYPKEPNAV